jgi:hypothetical protein
MRSSIEASGAANAWKTRLWLSRERFILVFGGLAIMVTDVTVDPLALRRRLSPGLPLSNDQILTAPKNETGLVIARPAGE